jgi:hypothetical protein
MNKKRPMTEVVDEYKNKNTPISEVVDELV